MALSKAEEQRLNDLVREADVIKLCALNEADNLRKAITQKTKAIMYCSPNNPTGTVFSKEELRKLADIALEKNLMIITDEAYEYFTYDGQKHFSIASIPEMRKNVISCYTFTKTYAMTGWRIGYLHADEELIPQLKKAHIPLAICAPVVSQYAALAALKGSQDCVKKFRGAFFPEKSRLYYLMGSVPQTDTGRQV